MPIFHLHIESISKRTVVEDGKESVEVVLRCNGQEILFSGYDWEATLKGLDGRGVTSSTPPSHVPDDASIHGQPGFYPGVDENAEFLDGTVYLTLMLDWQRDPNNAGDNREQLHIVASQCPMHVEVDVSEDGLSAVMRQTKLQN